MKKLLSRMLLLAMCLSLLTAPALAAETVVLPEVTEGEYSLSLRDMETVGDTAYLLMSVKDEAQLWHWRADMPQAEKIADRLIPAEYWDSMDILRQSKNKANHDLEHAISAIFTDGEKLYGFNHLNGLVYTISETENGIAYEDVTTLADTSAICDAGMEYNSFISPIEVMKSGDWLLWYAMDRAARNYDERLLAFNLKTGGVKQAVLSHPYEVTAYKDGKVLALCGNDSRYQQAGYTLYSYDPQTDLVELVGTIPIGVAVRHIEYSPELDRLVYLDKTRIMGWSEEGGHEQLGFIPTSDYVNFITVGDLLLYGFNYTSSISACGLKKDYAAEHSLNILGGTVDNVISQFYKKYMDVPYYYMNLEKGETYASMMARDTNAPDMAMVSAEEFIELRDAGLLLDLTGFADVKAYTDVLYPVYQDFITKDGGMYGVPASASTYDGWYINKAIMKDMGLTAEDIPTSLTELCEFATKWNNEYAEKYPHYTLLNETGEYRERIFYAMMEGWADYCEFAGKDITMDDPIVREMLAALDAAQLDKLNAALKQTDPEISEYKQALIWTGVKDVGNWACYMEDFSDRIFLPITLTPETPYTAAVDDFRLWVVNANSDNAEYAAALIAEYAQKLRDAYAYVLRSDKTEPVKNDYYTEAIAYEREVLATLESRLAESVNPATIEKRIATQKAYIETELARQEYTIFASAIKNYVEVILPGAFVDLPDAIKSSDRDPEMTGMFNHYIGGTLDADTLIVKVEELLK